MKLTKKQSIIAGVVVAVVAALGSAAMLAPQDLKDKASNLIPGHTEEAAPAAEPTPIQAPAAKEVESTGPKATS